MSFSWDATFTFSPISMGLNFATQIICSLWYIHHKEYFIQTEACSVTTQNFYHQAVLHSRLKPYLLFRIRIQSLHMGFLQKNYTFFKSAITPSCLSGGFTGYGVASSGNSFRILLKFNSPIILLKLMRMKTYLAFRFIPIKPLLSCL